MTNGTDYAEGVANRTRLTAMKVAELPGFAEFASSGQVLTLTGSLTAAYEELTNKT